MRVVQYCTTRSVMGLFVMSGCTDSCIFVCLLMLFGCCLCVVVLLVGVVVFVCVCFLGGCRLSFFQETYGVEKPQFCFMPNRAVQSRLCRTAKHDMPAISVTKPAWRPATDQTVTDSD